MILLRAIVFALGLAVALRGGAKVAIDEYSSTTSATTAVVILYGSGGLRRTTFPYAKQAHTFARGDRSVYLPHYLDTTQGSPNDPQRHYELWARTVRDALAEIWSRTGIPATRTFLIGYSLGASVALAVGATEPHLAGIVVWSGSLPDAYRDVRELPPILILHGARDSLIPEYNAHQLATLCTLRRFACDLKIYPDEGHAFSKAGIADADSQIDRFIDRVEDR